MRTSLRFYLALLLVLVVTGCTGEPAPPSPEAPATAPQSSGPAAVGGQRPVRVTVPPGHRAGAPAPLLIVLHGYGGSPAVVDRYFGLAAVAATAGMLYALPEGTTDERGNRFWNADEACCDSFDTRVDDSAYLRGVIEEIQRRYTVDTRRIFVVGLSNGGFMAHRLACDHADLVAAIVSVAGAGPLRASACTPARPVAVLQVHGDADLVVAYQGGSLDAEHPGALRTVEDWARRNGCAAVARSGPARDLATAADVETPGSRPLDGAETRTVSYRQGCRAGGHVELWTMVGADHVPALTPTYGRQVVDFLLAHPKP